MTDLTSHFTKAIITDLDGTILPSGGNISTATIASLQQLASRNILRIIATGRTLFAAQKYLPDSFPIDYLVFSSGAGIMEWKTKKIVGAHHLSVQETRKIATYLWDFNINFTIQKEIPDNHYFYYTYLYPAHSDYLRRIEKFKEFGQEIGSPEEIRTPATQFVMILEPRQLPLIDKVRKDLATYSVVRSTSPIDQQAIWLEIYPPHVNKGSTCKELLKQLDISPTDCAGIGNDYNDIDFLDICGKAYLVENAPQALKNLYKTVASDINNGFLEFIQEI